MSSAASYASLNTVSLKERHVFASVDDELKLTYKEKTKDYFSQAS
jgi:hypothetical protein